MAKKSISLSQGMLQAKALARSKELMESRKKARQEIRESSSVARDKARAKLSEMANVARVARGRDRQMPRMRDRKKR